ncbi:hypothetical protein ACQ4PT_002354 [Festuca glaucescens]
MDVHSTDRAKKIRKAIHSYLGVDKVSVSPQTGLVVITGPAAADAEMLRRLIQYKLRRPVNIVSDGGATEPVDDGWGANHWAPPPQFAQAYGGRVLPHPYGVPQQSYPYAGSHWAPPPSRDVSYGVPARHDDEEGPESCCSIQ